VYFTGNLKIIIFDITKEPAKNIYRCSRYATILTKAPSKKGVCSFALLVQRIEQEFPKL
tara:strand:- start:155 stop:331 length:177 start_codon:yes stop_codon:yes gene_type:complete